MAKTTEAQARARNKWNAANMEKITATVPIGYKDKARALADDRGLSVNKLICALIDDALAAAPAGAATAKAEGAK